MFSMQNYILGYYLLKTAGIKVIIFTGASAGAGGYSTSLDVKFITVFICIYKDDAVKRKSQYRWSANSKFQ